MIRRACTGMCKTPRGHVSGRVSCDSVIWRGGQKRNHVRRLGWRKSKILSGCCACNRLRRHYYCYVDGRSLCLFLFLSLIRARTQTHTRTLRLARAICMHETSSVAASVFREIPARLRLCDNGGGCLLGAYYTHGFPASCYIKNSNSTGRRRRRRRGVRRTSGISHVVNPNAQWLYIHYTTHIHTHTHALARTYTQVYIIYTRHQREINVFKRGH